MRVTVLKEIPDDPDLCKAWNALVFDMHNPEVFLTYQWALAAQRSFHKGQSPLVFLMHDAGQLVGVAALATARSMPGEAFFLTSSTADYCDLVSTPPNRQAVLLALLEESQALGLENLVFANVPSDSATFLGLASIVRSRGFYVASRISYNCRVVQLGGPKERETLLHSLSNKGRERRALKKLSSLGSVKVIHFTEPGQIAVGLEAIISAQISRFLASARISPLVEPERRAFLSHLSELLFQSGWLKISQLEIDGRPVAWNYGFRFGGSWFWYLPTFQMQYEHVSPGSCLLRLLVEEGAKDPSVQWFDLGLGNEPYKDRFANYVRQTSHVRLSHGLRRHVANVGRQTLSSTADRFPDSAERLRKTRTLYQSVAARIQGAGVLEAACHSMHRAAKYLAAQDEVLLFEAPASQGSESGTFRLLPMTQDDLVEASIANSGNGSALGYLMRSARRLKESGNSGFVLQDEQSRPSHFLWIDRYDGFRVAEIDHSLDPLSPDAVMIFDCWTPPASRGQGHYAAAIRQIAARLRREGRNPWIFSGAGNVSSLRGIVNAGFLYRFSLIRRRTLGRSVVTRHDSTTTSAAFFAEQRARATTFSNDRDDVARNAS